MANQRVPQYQVVALGGPVDVQTGTADQSEADRNRRLLFPIQITDNTNGRSTPPIGLFNRLREAGYDVTDPHIDALARKYWAEAALNLSNTHGASPLIPAKDRLSPLSLECQTIIFDLVDPLDLAKLGSSSAYYRSAIQEHYMHRTHAAIAKYGICPRSAMRILFKTRSIIGGAVPIFVLTMSFMLPADLVFYCPASQEETMVALIKANTGLECTKSNIDTFNRSVFRAEYRFGPKTQAIVIRVSVGENALMSTFYASTTELMNFISCHGIFCAVPTLTLMGMGLSNHGSRGGYFDAIYDKSAAGVLVAKPWSKFPHKCNRSSICASTVRSLYDGRSLFVRFPAERPVSIVYDRAHTVIWCLGACWATPRPTNESSFVLSSPIHMR
ncbi:hypothetical protein C8J57DRAFT_1391238 [Mycena rebaudengoi]|nr:hypothetical protein C8J57DRAFT_1419914 [Mycena rebaudengoi]KAJ7224003.1 hypothetical protein C8J57DRAFT_1391238 [Mycena rebaudengoi]